MRETSHCRRKLEPCQSSLAQLRKASSGGSPPPAGFKNSPRIPAAGSGSGGEMSRKRKLEPDANGEGASGGDTNEPIAESWSKTEQYKVKGRHRWTIDNFVRRASCTEVGDSICSTVFYIPIKAYSGEVQNLAFQLEVFPNGEEGEDNSD